MDNWFVLSKGETRIIERFWGSCSMVFNNTSPHPTPLPDWLVSLSCLYLFGPRTYTFPTVPCVWNSWTLVHFQLYPVFWIHGLFYISNCTPCLEFMDSCTFPTVPRVWNSWTLVHFQLYPVFGIHGLLCISNCTQCLEFMDSCTFPIVPNVWNSWTLVHFELYPVFGIYGLLYISNCTPCLEFMDSCTFPTVPRVWNSWTLVHFQLYPVFGIHGLLYISNCTPCLEFMDSCTFPTVPRVWNSWIPLPLNIRTTRSFATSGIIYPFLQRIQNSTNSRYLSFHKFLSSRLPLCNFRTGI